jgi:hypothetical protein
MENKEGDVRRMRRIKAVTIGSHPSLYAKMEQLRKMYQEQAGMKLSQIQITNLIAQKVRIPNKINILGGKNENKKKR